MKPNSLINRIIEFLIDMMGTLLISTIFLVAFFGSLIIGSRLIDSSTIALFGETTKGNTLLALGIIFMCVMILFSFFNLVSIWKEKRDHRNATCPHGIKTNRKGIKCEVCDQEQKEKVKIAEEREKEYHKKRIITQKSRALREAEVIRVADIEAAKEETVLQLKPFEFENFIAKLFRDRGYKVEQTSYSNDKGKDAFAYKDGKKYLIECKRYKKDAKIGRPALQKFYAALVEEKALKGFFVATCGFSMPAKDYVKDKNIDLIGMANLKRLIKETYGTKNEDIYKTMCLECGAVVHFSFDENTHEKMCINGHYVKPDTELLALSMSALTNTYICNNCKTSFSLVNTRKYGYHNCPKCKRRIYGL